jgi:lysozyme
VTHISQAGIDVIKKWEGIEDGDPRTANLDPYMCSAGYWTIGWGHVVLDEDGNMLHGRENHDLAYHMMAGGIDMAQAETLLRADLVKFEKHVLRYIGNSDTSQQEFDAFVCLTFNIGPGNFAKSSVLRYHLAGQKYPHDNDEDRLGQIIASGHADNAADAFLMWSKANVHGVMTALNGLINRRKDERFLYMYGEL